MFQFLQPIWLYALAGLSIPVIIHLWNQQPGKTLRIGSIALVTENAVSHKKSIRLTELFLLLLRCLLLSCIAIALAGPLWRNPAKNGAKGWVLMSRPALTTAYNYYKPLVDSLLQAGLEFHYFEEGFAKENFEKAVNAVPDTSIAIKKYAYRNIAALLNSQADAKLPLYIFTDNYLRNFAGIRSAVSLNLHWYTYTPDTASTKPVIDPIALRITIFSHAHANDAHYLKAALDAIQQFSKRNIITRLVTDAQDIPAQQDWLFWLADDSNYNNKTARNVVAYAKGKPLPCASYILPAGRSSFDAAKLYVSIIEKDSTRKFSDILWKDGFGHPLLAVQEKNNKANYWLYTHIDPAWNELPWSDNFPQLLYKLIYANRDKEISAGITDNTIIDSSQLLPVIMPKKDAGIKPAVFTETKLAGICWLIAFILFFGERCLSFYHRKITANG
ncbi:MAG TPA: BatA domain-containing protein [Chitinophagaceae bacterium]|nr:BatA domain-containing protein [Chitinophagaceae bacterium]